jgi:Ca2+-binding EF-hand superfamily protein
MALEVAFSPNIVPKYRRDRRGETSKYFSLVDKDGKGFISVYDIQLLAGQTGETIEVEEAKAIMRHSSSRGEISEPVFHVLLSPQSP